MNRCDDDYINPASVRVRRDAEDYGGGEIVGAVLAQHSDALWEVLSVMVKHRAYAAAQRVLGSAGDFLCRFGTESLSEVYEAARCGAAFSTLEVAYDIEEKSLRTIRCRDRARAARYAESQ